MRGRRYCSYPSATSLAFSGDRLATLQTFVRLRMEHRQTRDQISAKKMGTKLMSRNSEFAITNISVVASERRVEVVVGEVERIHQANRVGLRNKQ